MLKAPGEFSGLGLARSLSGSGSRPCAST